MQRGARDRQPLPHSVREHRRSRVGAWRKSRTVERIHHPVFHGVEAVQGRRETQVLPRSEIIVEERLVRQESNGGTGHRVATERESLDLNRATGRARQSCEGPQ